jgi:hypothetical protein
MKEKMQRKRLIIVTILYVFLYKRTQEQITEKIPLTPIATER